MKKSLFAVTTSALILTGCGAEVYDCSHPDVTSKVIDIQSQPFNKLISKSDAVENLLKDYSYKNMNPRKYSIGYKLDFETELKELKLDLKDIRTVNANKKLGNYACKATLYTNITGADDKGIEVLYTSETTDDGRAYIDSKQVREKDIESLMIDAFIIKIER